MSFLSILTLILPAVIIAVFIKFTIEYLKNRRLFNKLAGPKDLLFIGNAHQLPSDPSGLRVQLYDWAVEYRAQGFNTGRFWVGMVPYVITFGAEDVETIVHSSKHLSKGKFYEYIMPWLGTGLLTSDGSKWKSRRRLLTPSFHFNILNDFMAIFNEQARIFARKIGDQGEKPADMHNLVTRCTLDVICETAMGIQMETQSGKNTEYVDAVHGLSTVVTFRTTSPWILSKLLYPLLPMSWREAKHLRLVKNFFTRKVIEARRSELLSQGEEVEERSKRTAFLATLLKTQIELGEIDDEGIQEEVDTFMFEGHDTTASGITWAIQMIGAHPEVLKKLHAEVDEVFGDSDRDVTSDDLKRLEYLSRVLKEVMRLCPPVPHIGRELTEDAQVGGVMLPAGSNVVITIYSLHRDPKYFPEPHKFDPDRFLPENAEGRHPYCYIPFSAGPRNCIGQKFAQMEEKVILSWLLRRYTWETQHEFEGMNAAVELILRPTRKMDIKIRPRID